MYVPDIFQHDHCVFDEESLLQRLSQIFGRTFDEICQFSKHLGNNRATVENITVVFDGGYLVPSKKGSKHTKRNKRRLRRKVVPFLHNLLTVKKRWLSSA